MTEPIDTHSSNGEGSSNLFQPRLNDTGKKYILRLFKMGNFILIMNSLLCILYIFLDIMRLSRADPIYDDIELSYDLYSGYLIIYNAINLISVYFYVRFSKKIKRSIEINDENGLNLSFKYIYVNGLLFTVSLVVAILSEFLFALFKAGPGL